MVRIAVAVLRVVASTDVVSEDVVVETIRTYEPVYQFVNLFIAPFSAHACPPAERYAPTFDGLFACVRIDYVRCTACFDRCILVVRQVPQVHYARSVLVGESIRTVYSAVCTQTLAVDLVAESYVIASGTLNGVFCLFRRVAFAEVCVPLSFKLHEAVAVGTRNVVVAVAERYDDELSCQRVVGADNGGVVVTVLAQNLSA